VTEDERKRCVEAAIGLTAGARQFAELFTATLGRPVTRDEALAVIASTRHRVGRRGMNKKMKLWRSF